jgi:phage tail sheath protein FI
VASDIIGTTNADGTRTGLKALKDAKSTYGFAPKQIIAPGFTTLTGVMTEMDSIAAALRAIAWVDAQVALSPTQAIAARATTLNSASKRVMICYPSVKALGPDGTAVVLQPLSQFAAGACAARDQQKGYWWSPSGMELKGATGLERPIDGSFQDANAELNLLNASGITTVYAGFGTGYRIWGNRSAAFPANNDPDSFLAVRRTADVIEESLEYACLKFVDNPITKALVDQILDDANAFIRALVGRGAVVDGKAFYDPAKNTSDQLAGGHLTLGYRFMPPAPLERLSFEAYLDVNLYANAMK